MIIPLGYSQVNLRFTGAAVPNGAEVVLGINQDAAITDPAVVADDVAANWVAHILPFQVDDIDLASSLCKFGPNDDGPFAEVVVGQGGGSSSAGWTPNVSVLVTKVTARGGRKGRGRMYIPGFPESTANEAGDLASGTIVELQPALDSFLGALAADDVPMVLLHSDDSPLDIPNTVTSLQLQARVATQRRRLRR